MPPTPTPASSSTEPQDFSRRHFIQYAAISLSAPAWGAVLGGCSSTPDAPARYPIDTTVVKTTERMVSFAYTPPRQTAHAGVMPAPAAPPRSRHPVPPRLRLAGPPRLGLAAGAAMAARDTGTRVGPTAWVGHFMPYTRQRCRPGPAGQPQRLPRQPLRPRLCPRRGCRPPAGRGLRRLSRAKHNGRKPASVGNAGET